MLAITVMKAMQIHSRHGLSRGSLANLYFAHSELHSPWIERTIHGLSHKARNQRFVQSNPRIAQIHALHLTYINIKFLYFSKPLRLL